MVQMRKARFLTRLMIVRPKTIRFICQINKPGGRTGGNSGTNLSFDVFTSVNVIIRTTYIIITECGVTKH